MVTRDDNLSKIRSYNVYLEVAQRELCDISLKKNKAVGKSSTFIINLHTVTQTEFVGFLWSHNYGWEVKLPAWYVTRTVKVASQH